MEREEAHKLIMTRQLVYPGGYTASDGYWDLEHGDPAKEMLLDGVFTLNELKAFIWCMEHNDWPRR